MPVHDPYDADRPLMLRCACGEDHVPQDHGAADREQQSRDFIVSKTGWKKSRTSRA